MTLYTTNNNEGANEKVKPHLLPIHNIYINNVLNIFKRYILLRHPHPAKVHGFCSAQLQKGLELQSLAPKAKLQDCKPICLMDEGFPHVDYGCQVMSI